jgi:alpha-N-arabinofuranosidase
MKYQNPIIPGFNPDPSICRVGDDFYVVTSSFEYFPGVPIYHSRNLVNWELIGHCLTRDSQLQLEHCAASKRIYAPTIRHKDGIFYMITTNAAKSHYNFIVHTENIHGEWSEPAWIDMRGIDPSLFWDDDGTCYCCLAVMGIGMFAINPLTGEKLSDMRMISSGCGGSSPEAPHIYKKDGWYYLLLAEGGTEYGHRVTVQRAAGIWGPYEPCPDNPILTHKELDTNPIQGTGHADIFDDAQGNWWMVCLGFRTLGGTQHHTLGRETFLTPLSWRKGEWPQVEGKQISLEMDGPLPSPAQPVDHSLVMDCTTPLLDKRFVHTRNPNRENYAVDADAHTLTLTGSGARLSDEGASSTLLCVRQSDFYTLTRISLDVDKCQARKFGVTAFHMNRYHYDMYLSGGTGKLTLNFSKSIHDGDFRTACIPFDRHGLVTLFILTDKSKYAFGFETEQGERIIIGEGASVGLASETMNPRSYTGTMIGVFCEDGVGLMSRFEMTIVPEEKPVCELKTGPLDYPLSELLANEKAASLLQAELPELMNNPMLENIKSMSLRKLSTMGGGMLSQNVLNVLEQKLNNQ